MYGYLDECWVDRWINENWIDGCGQSYKYIDGQRDVGMDIQMDK